MSETSESDFGDFLRVRRTSRGLTQAALARQLDVAPETVCRWERGKTRPRLRRRPPLGWVLAARLEPPPKRAPKRLAPERVAAIAAGVTQIVHELRAFD